jgi:hypothetical protein
VAHHCADWRSRPLRDAIYRHAAATDKLPLLRLRYEFLFDSRSMPIIICCSLIQEFL